MLASVLLFTSVFVFGANAYAFGVELTKNRERPLIEKRKQARKGVSFICSIRGAGSWEQPCLAQCGAL